MGGCHGATFVRLCSAGRVVEKETERETRGGDEKRTGSVNLGV